MITLGGEKKNDKETEAEDHIIDYYWQSHTYKIYQFQALTDGLYYLRRIGDQWSVYNEGININKQERANMIMMTTMIIVIAMTKTMTTTTVMTKIDYIYYLLFTDSM